MTVKELQNIISKAHPESQIVHLYDGSYSYAIAKIGLITFDESTCDIVEDFDFPRDGKEVTKDHIVVISSADDD